MSVRRTPATWIAALLGSWAPLGLSAQACTPSGPEVTLPSELFESSGVAFSRARPGILWTHNDDGSVLHAIDPSGDVRGRIELDSPLRDWEDIEVGACASGSCLYLADLGDNQEVRRPGAIRVLRIPEPELTSGGTGAAIRPQVFPVRLPDGPRDIEALFVLPGERLHVVTKGRNHAITVYRYPPPLRPETVTLEEVQRLTFGPAFVTNQVTGASTDPSGTIVAVRTYLALRFYRVQADTLALIDDATVDLLPLREGQGEAVAIGPDGAVALTSEAGRRERATMNLMSCGVARGSVG